MFWKTIATGFGAGYSPIAPGTAGALVALAILFFFDVFVFTEGGIYCGNYTAAEWAAFEKRHFELPFLGHYIDRYMLMTLSILTLTFFFLGAAATDKLEAEWGHDPSKVVADEMVGMWISLLFVPLSADVLFVAFVLFRFFDIVKPLGIRRMEQLPGGWGVMMDDVLAGVYSLILVHFYLYLT